MHDAFADGPARHERARMTPLSIHTPVNAIGKPSVTTTDCPGRPRTWAEALADAREFLAVTVEAINPGTPAKDLLGYAAESRAHLAALVEACSAHESGHTP